MTVQWWWRTLIRLADAIFDGVVRDLGDSSRVEAKTLVDGYADGRHRVPSESAAPRGVSREGEPRGGSRVNKQGSSAPGKWRTHVCSEGGTPGRLGTVKPSFAGFITSR